MKLITFEGIDGSGKTTLWQNLKEELKNESNIEFVKSPVSPFTSMIGNFWDADIFERFIFFLCSNSYLAKSCDKNRTYVIDRFIYSTFITHVDLANPQNNDFMISIIKRMNITCPTMTFLISASKKEVKRRLKERNNNIDNSLDIDKLYSCYYELSLNTGYDNLFGKMKIISNELEQDLQVNTKIIRDAILAET
ncbi:MAG: deoxynucleoside kinase [Nostoc sp.]|uniref:deoxynucleoside kinase n=1 Tax=Nostoc sp. TaxID=1180 RepID=UPI002FF7A2D1